jgi:hypothetical protein
VGKEINIVMTVFNANNILSITTARRILCTVVIFIELLYPEAKDACVFAQTAETAPGRVYSEIGGPSQASPDDG